MTKRLQLLITSLAILLPFFAIMPASGQGLVWSLPKDQSWVRYEGDFKQLLYRPDNKDGDLKLQWRRHLEIRSVGKATETYKGKETPCRWIEFETITGKEVDGQVDPGPGGLRIFKVLVPESAIPKIVKSGARPPLEFLPIVRGYRMIGEQEPEKLPAGVLQVYPTITLLRHFRGLKSSEELEDVDLPQGAVSAMLYKATLTLESPSTRSTNTTQVWVSKEIPFGLAKWNVTIARESKANNEDRKAFERKSEITITMSMNESGADAQSKIAAQ